MFRSRKKKKPKATTWDTCSKFSGLKDMSSLSYVWMSASSCYARHFCGIFLEQLVHGAP